MAIVTSQGMPLQLAKEIDEMYVTTLASIDSEYNKVLKIESAPAGRTHYQAEFVGLGLGGEIGESESVPYDTPVEGHPKIDGYKQYGAGYGITDLAIKDDYHGKLKTLPADLAKMQNTLVELEGLRFYNEAELGGTGATSLVKDGNAICNAAGHSLMKPVIPFQQDGANTGANKLYNIPETASALSETSLREAYEYYDFMVDEKGVPQKMNPNMLMVSQRDQYIANRLLRQEYGSSVDLGGIGYYGDTAPTSGNLSENVKNFANPGNGFINPYSVMVSRYMDAGRWFFNAAEHDNKLFWKEQPTQESKYDFDTRTTRYSSVMRFGVWAYEYRGTYGNIIGVSRTA